MEMNLVKFHEYFEEWMNTFKKGTVKEVTYDVIKDRKGETINCTFVKKEDLK
ncbi:hypothetical protein SN811_01280 [Ligilactobacillus agilis]|uniref:Uncharacterized protein n=1 Tax=Ligilactobacillus agilis TaxID=1601 RepID=A0A6F9Y2G6_9LACO|nr:hypothetical protein SN811_01280 [Ligilactobacillus agilis]